MQGVSVRPFLALSRAQRTSDFNLERIPHARVWFLDLPHTARTHTTFGNPMMGINSNQNWSYSYLMVSDFYSRHSVFQKVEKIDQTCCFELFHYLKNITYK